jgi:hypothetical protein
MLMISMGLAQQDRTRKSQNVHFKNLKYKVTPGPYIENSDHFPSFQRSHCSPNPPKEHRRPVVVLQSENRLSLPSPPV